jgi:hypothetical protein
VPARGAEQPALAVLDDTGSVVWQPISAAMPAATARRRIIR